MYLEGEEQTAEPADYRVERVKTPLLGLVSAGLGLLTAVLVGAAVAIASGGDYGLSTILAHGAIALSVLGVIGGAVAAIAGLGRRWGIIAVVLGVLANPFVLLSILRFFGGFESG
jgi:hypothetical protein